MPSLRRTNEIIIHSDQRMVVKRYRTSPPSVAGQVFCGLRRRRALLAVHRWETEKLKVEAVRSFGIALPFEYHGFYEGRLGYDSKPFVVMEYLPGFLTAEDRLRNGMSTEEAFQLVGRCAVTLSDFHLASNGHGKRMAHGDPYLENFDGADAKLFDFEHDHPCDGGGALVRDQLIFFWHAVNVLKDTGHLKTRRDLERLIDTVHTGYPGMETSVAQLGALQKLYFKLRFMGKELQK
ncbi:MAG TPA: hypothetical protein VJH24_02235 [Candidatus Bilamarchaeaceae archaeon]|nr:hypothetical protein [Candidatus Bilamarchaeaceae archaeon]